TPTDSRCQLHYFLVGSFGGQGGFVNSAADGSEYDIPTRQGHIAVDRLKAYLQCTKYQVETIAFETLPPPGKRYVHRELKPLGTVPFFGRVRGLTGSQRDALSVEIDFMGSWVCRFFQLIDCAFGGTAVANPKIAFDGTFNADIPDFANDPAIASYG